MSEKVKSVVRTILWSLVGLLFVVVIATIESSHAFPEIDGRFISTGEGNGLTVKLITDEEKRRAYVTWKFVSGLSNEMPSEDTVSKPIPKPGTEAAKTVLVLNRMRLSHQRSWPTKVIDAPTKYGIPETSQQLESSLFEERKWNYLKAIERLVWVMQNPEPVKWGAWDLRDSARTYEFLYRLLQYDILPLERKYTIMEDVDKVFLQEVRLEMPNLEKRMLSGDKAAAIRIDRLLTVGNFSFKEVGLSARGVGAFCHMIRCSWGG